MGWVKGRLLCLPESHWAGRVGVLGLGEREVAEATRTVEVTGPPCCKEGASRVWGNRAMLGVLPIQ